jgi:hypothetical protein
MAIKSAAVLTIKGAPDMSKQGARDIAEWLRKQASMLEKADERQALDARYRARYLYEDK